MPERTLVRLVEVGSVLNRSWPLTSRVGSRLCPPPVLVWIVVVMRDECSCRQRSLDQEVGGVWAQSDWASRCNASLTGSVRADAGRVKARLRSRGRARRECRTADGDDGLAQLGQARAGRVQRETAGGRLTIRGPTALRPPRSNSARALAWTKATHRRERREIATAAACGASSGRCHVRRPCTQPFRYSSSQTDWLRTSSSLP